MARMIGYEAMKVIGWDDITLAANICGLSTCTIRRFFGVIGKEYKGYSMIIVLQKFIESYMKQRNKLDDFDRQKVEKFIDIQCLSLGVNPQLLISYKEQPIKPKSKRRSK